MAWGDKHMRYQRMEEVLGVDDLASGLITPAVNEGGAATFAALPSSHSSFTHPLVEAQPWTTDCRTA